MALLHFSPLYSCCSFFLLALTLLQSPQVYGGETESRHVVSVPSLLPSSVCSLPRDSKPSMLKVVHRHGPCSPLSPRRETPAPVTLLSQDQARVDWLHRRTSAESNRDSTRASLTATVPANSGGPIGTGNYVVDVGFGTPKKVFTVIFDTGSDLTWIQCSPCPSGGCYPQQQQLFDPSQSSSYSNILCNSTVCTNLDSYYCSANRCRYEVDYSDESQSKGFFGTDILTLTTADVLPNFLFGCGDQNSGLFGKAAGLLGLGRGSVSLVRQASTKYGGVFSYCLPSSSSSTGYLTLGGAPSNVQFTPMLDNNAQSFYFLHLVAIKVGGQQLAISPAVFSKPGTLIDSGTVITRLPPSAYYALRDKFRQLMAMYKTAPPLSILDTCYNFTGNDTVSVPTVALVFDGETTLNVDFTGILYVASTSQACLAFAANEDPNDVGIIGNMQQKRFNVVYDLPHQRIGFGAGGCS